MRLFFTDIAVSWRAERELKEIEEKYRLLVKYAPAGIWELDLVTGRFLSVSDVMCQYTGYTQEEFLALNARWLSAKMFRPRWNTRYGSRPASSSGLG